MANEPNTGLTLSPPGPLQADLIVNPVIRRLGSVGGNTTGVIDKDLSTPPGSPSTGDKYIIGGSPTGVWSGRANQIAYYDGVIWQFWAPVEGWRIAVLDEDTDYRYNGSSWVIQSSGAFTGGAMLTALDEAKFADIASAATTNIGAAAGNYGHVTGTITTTALGTAQAGASRTVVYDGAQLLTHHATSMILITGANITTAAGDVAEWRSEGSGNWRMVNYARKDGTSLGGSPGSVSSVNGDTGVVLVLAPIIVAASDESSPISAGTAKVTFRMPYAMTLTEIPRASLTQEQSSGSIFTVDINESGSSILSTKLTIDNTEKTSTTATTPAVLSDFSLANDAEITIDVDQIGDGTAEGLKVTLIGYAS